MFYSTIIFLLLILIKTINNSSFHFARAKKKGHLFKFNFEFQTHVEENYILLSKGGGNYMKNEKEELLIN